jgi:hypothetical protein
MDENAPTAGDLPESGAAAGDRPAAGTVPGTPGWSAEPLLGILTQLVGVAAVLVGFVYGIGAGIVFLRLLRAGSPTAVNLIGNLPRQLLLSSAFLGVVVPAMILAVGFVSIIVVSGGEAARIWAWAARLRSNRRLLLTSAVISAIATAAASFPLVRSTVSESHTGDGHVGQTVFWLIISFALQTVFALAGLRTMNLIARARQRGSRPFTASTAAGALVVAVMFIPSLMLYSAGVGFTQAVICPRAGARIEAGLLIGESPDRIYLLTPATQASVRTAVSYPADLMKELILGPRTGASSCR